MEIKIEIKNKYPTISLLIIQHSNRIEIYMCMYTGMYIYTYPWDVWIYISGFHYSIVILAKIWNNQKYSVVHLFKENVSCVIS